MVWSHSKFSYLRDSLEPTSNCVGNKHPLSLLNYKKKNLINTLIYKYNIIWCLDCCRFYVDNIPIRVYKNNRNIGVEYPSQPMQIEGSLWDGDSWATDGGQTKTNWTYAPFQAHFQGFEIGGCAALDNSNIQHCYSPNYWWNTGKYWKLDSRQQREYENVRNKYINYDYCFDRHRYPIPPPECLAWWSMKTLKNIYIYT